jgi:murein DD-endopeptidase MepM/ murein hydrolase activator NlpD
MHRPLHHSRRWPTNHVLPALLGIGAAAVLGGAGFGLGCLYAQVVVAAPVVVQIPLAQAQAGAASPPVPRVLISAAVGGPEEPAPLDANPAVVRPARALARTVGMARPVVGGWVSSHYGLRRDPFTGQPAVHRGLDFTGLDNSAILAVAPGVVTWSGRQRGYGNLIEIDHGNGWVTRYGHNSFNLVTPGDYVKPGQTIALMGSTGRATGTHLHFEVLYRGRYQNPTRFVPLDA